MNLYLRASPGQFQTGLTVNVFRLKKESALDKGRRIIDQLAATKHGEKWAQDVGQFKEFSCLTKDTDASGTTVMHTLTVANPKTNTLYLLIFESPQSDWDSAWKIANRLWTRWRATMKSERNCASACKSR